MKMTGQSTCTIPDAEKLCLLLLSLLSLVLLSAGLSYLVSVLCALQPSFCPLTGVLLQLWFWATPLAWQEERGTVSAAEGGSMMKCLSATALNPLRSMAENYREALAGCGTPCSAGRIIMPSLAVLAAGIGVFLLRKGEIADAM